jgi:alpha-tubulin suppressor-like RCC1 family protein
MSASTTARTTAAAGDPDAPSPTLPDLPPDLLSRVVSLLPAVEDIGRVDCVGRPFHAAPHSVVRENSPVAEGLRLRAASRGGGTRPVELGGGAALTQALCLAELRERAGCRQPLSAGDSHHALVNPEGGLLTCGTEEEGSFRRLGHGGAVVVAVPTLVPALAAVRIASVSASSTHTLTQSDDGAVYSFGRGSGGRLGHGDEEDQWSPKVIEALSGVHVCAVSAGHHHSLVLSADGTVYSCGFGFSAALGHGSNEDRWTPSVIRGLQGVHVVGLAAGIDHSLALESDGKVRSWGNGVHGQLGHGTQDTQLAPHAIETLENVRLCAVAAGNGYSLVLGVNGEVYSFGKGNSGRLGHGDEENQMTPKRIEMDDPVRAVAAGHAHSMLLCPSGAVYSFGWGAGGRLGHGDNEDQLAPRRIEALCDVTVSAIAAGNVTSIASAAGGTAYGWGYGLDDSLGLRLEVNQLVPMQYPNVRAME